MINELLITWIAGIAVALLPIAALLGASFICGIGGNEPIDYEPRQLELLK